MTGILSAWLVELGILTYRGFKQNQNIAGLPYPSTYLASMVLYGGLSLIPAGNSGARNLGTTVAWGFTIATALNLVNASSPTLKKTASTGAKGTPGATLTSTNTTTTKAATV